MSCPHNYDITVLFLCVQLVNVICLSRARVYNKTWHFFRQSWCLRFFMNMCFMNMTFYLCYVTELNSRESQQKTLPVVKYPIYFSSNETRRHFHKQFIQHLTHEHHICKKSRQEREGIALKWKYLRHGSSPVLGPGSPSNKQLWKQLSPGWRGLDGGGEISTFHFRSVLWFHSELNHCMRTEALGEGGFNYYYFIPCSRYVIQV